MIPDTSKWRSSSYDYVDRIAPSDLAWEWLRRNGHYQRDYHNHAETNIPGHQTLTRANWPSLWGLRFPNFAQPQRHRHRHFLDTGGLHLDRPADRRACRSV